MSGAMPNCYIADLFKSMHTLHKLDLTLNVTVVQPRRDRNKHRGIVRTKLHMRTCAASSLRMHMYNHDMIIIVILTKLYTHKVNQQTTNH